MPTYHGGTKTIISSNQNRDQVIMNHQQLISHNASVKLAAQSTIIYQQSIETSNDRNIRSTHSSQR